MRLHGEERLVELHARDDEADMKADTLEELADMMGVPVASLVNRM